MKHGDFPYLLCRRLPEGIDPALLWGLKMFFSSSPTLEGCCFQLYAENGLLSGKVMNTLQRIFQPLSARVGPFIS